jgi:hypothetical protein
MRSVEIGLSQVPYGAVLVSEAMIILLVIVDE